jgi:hypothetical protein
VRTSKAFTAAATVLALVTLTALPAANAQGKFPPDSLVNVKVIPKDTPMSAVILAMRRFATSLGVRCTYCHVGEESASLETYDFASDQKRTKQAARVMMQMVNTINGQHLSGVPSRPSPSLTVTCETCHRGVPRPEPIERIVEAALAAGGLDSAKRAYRTLTSRYEHRGAYNFTEIPLTFSARQIASTRFDDAMNMLAVNEEAHPRSPSIATSRGDLLLSRRDTAGAVAAYRTALQRDSTFAPARAQLQRLGRQP